MSRRSRNEDKLADWLDGTLPTLHPGSPDPDMLPDDNAKGSRTLLYESMLKRLDGEKAGEEESHRLLMTLMVSPQGRLATERPRQHSALSEFVFGAPAGYMALLTLENMAAKGAPLAGPPAEDCRAGFERVLDYLDEYSVELSVRVVPTADSKQTAVVEANHDKVRTLFNRFFDSLGSESAALNATAGKSEYSRSQVERITEDLRGRERYVQEVRETFLAKLDRHGKAAKAISQTAEQTGYSASQVRRMTEDLRRKVG